MRQKKAPISLAGITLILIMFTVQAHSEPQRLERTNLLVENLSCSSCLNSIENELSAINGYIGMAGDLRRGQVMVDHEKNLDSDNIAAIITKTGYPARVDWTASISADNANNFPVPVRSAQSCGGGCSSGQNGGGSAGWGNADADTVQTTFKVDNLTCISCLSSIEESLRALPGTIGMKSDISNKLVRVAHNNKLDSKTIAATISGLGYPATITNDSINDSNTKNIATRAGSGCSTRNRPCSATASAWKTLYNRYVKD